MSNDNGDGKVDRLSEVEARIKALELDKENPEARKELIQLYDEKIKLTIKPQEAPKDFKIAEIWIKEGQLILDASPEFWIDKLRAIGVLEFCKKIVYEYGEQHKKVSIVDKLGMKKFVNNIKRRF